ncbi:hypothetical protein BQ8482_330192 [Mesorhizobium delmotii]|uniref:Uncharacterized protein n=1 Tax=Mesorhizobium delmotii TaxID=1631247 RepID=A0A2P9APG6_9HYPH|nr:hypothetical protein BQ8482_330192 [Mesorhizobium delmotii]
MRACAQKDSALGMAYCQINFGPSYPVVSAPDPDKIIAAVRLGHQALDSIH